MKGKRERRARQPPLPRGAAIPGACGEQRLEAAQFEGGDRHRVTVQEVQRRKTRGK